MDGLHYIVLHCKATKMWYSGRGADHNLTNGDGETPLAIAERIGHKNVVNVLRRKGLKRKIT